jgi:hypothetical protein
LYEPVVDDPGRYGGGVICAIDEAGLPVHELEHGFDLGYPAGAVVHSRIERGCVLPDIDDELSLFPGLPWNIFLVRRAAERVLTFESPRTCAWETRIAVHRVAVVAALTALMNDRG